MIWNAHGIDSRCDDGHWNVIVQADSEAVARDAVESHLLLKNRPDLRETMRISPINGSPVIFSTVEPR